MAIAGYTASVARNVRHGAVATVGMGLVGPLTRILTMLNVAGNLPDVTFNEVNDGQDNTGENAEEGTGEGDGGDCGPEDPYCEDSCHGNSLNSTKPQHGYEIYDNVLKQIVKVGISGQKLNQNGTSPRANNQVNRWNRETGNSGRYEVRKVYEDVGGNRGEAKTWEEGRAGQLRGEKQLGDEKRHRCP